MARPKQRSSTTHRQGKTKKAKSKNTESRKTTHLHPAKGYVLGDRCFVCGEPLYTSKEDATIKWCSDGKCRSHKK